MPTSSWRKSSPSSEPPAVAGGAGESDQPAASRPRRRTCPGAARWRGDLRARAVLIVDSNGETVLGPRFIRLLEEIDRAGSVRQAALHLGLGYRHALAWIGRAEQVLGRALVVRQAGGVAGGGSGLTAQGADLIRRYRRVASVLGRVVERAEHEILDVP
ncbi:MAG TPA: hypothetical protein VFW98_07570 [Gemmatimonadaceae bacterium]|nr:hypothetical protein [Gemmatimonadaceae bacterium]